jgi:hypothetical protein
MVLGKSVNWSQAAKMNGCTDPFVDQEMVAAYIGIVVRMDLDRRMLRSRLLGRQETAASTGPPGMRIADYTPAADGNLEYSA